MIHITCHTDHLFVKHCAVTLTSILTHTTEEQITIHLIGKELSTEDKKILSDTAISRGAKIVFYTPDDNLVKDFSIRATHGRLSIVTYFRIFLTEILPENIKKVLYVDCDIIALESIYPLYQTPLGENTAVVAVRDVETDEKERYTRLQYPIQEGYFNAGVMLINLEHWRTHNISRECVEYNRKNPERIVFNDQDLLNAVLHGKIHFAPVTWNMQDGFYRRTYTKKIPLNTLKNPAVIHYTNRKPWNYESQHPLRETYFKYLDLTVWAGERPWHSPKNRLLRFFRLLPFVLHLRKPKYIKL